MAADIEPQKNKLLDIDKDFGSQLFRLLNNFIRHNHDEKEYIVNLSKMELEEIYDDTYQMWLLAKLRLDNIERKKEFLKLIKHLQIAKLYNFRNLTLLVISVGE
jgi:hypothetical protein